MWRCCVDLLCSKVLYVRFCKDPLFQLTPHPNTPLKYALSPKDPMFLELLIQNKCHPKNCMYIWLKISNLFTKHKINQFSSKKHMFFGNFVTKTPSFCVFVKSHFHFFGEICFTESPIENLGFTSV